MIALESYEQFADNLQREIEKDTNIRFGIVEKHEFASVSVPGKDGRPTVLGVESSKAIWQHLKDSGYIDATGKVQDLLRKAIKDGKLALPAAYEGQRAHVTEILRKLSGRLDIKNADERVQIKPRRAVLNGTEFKALWDRIKHKTTYRVHFDNERLVDDCTKAVMTCPTISKTRLQWRKADLSIGKAGVEASETSSSASVTIEESDIELPDLLTVLQDKTQLTRRSLVSILTGSGRLEDFKRNPQQFIEYASEAINRTKRLALVDGIRYRRVGDDHYYAQELFEEKELAGYLRNIMNSEKSVYEHVVYDSDSEKTFAADLEKNTAIKVYAKLPGWFTIPTPLGAYNPDWAVLVEEETGDKVYFVVETKSSLFLEDLRNKEGGKITCGEAHFQALAVGENPAEFIRARNLDDVLGGG